MTTIRPTEPWITARIEEVTLSNIVKGAPTGNGLFKYVDIGCVDNKAKRIVDARLLLPDKAPTRARQHLLTGDVVVSMTRPNLNAVALVSEELDGAIGSTGFHVLRARDSVLPKWLFYFAQTKTFIDTLSANDQGVVYPAVRPKDIQRIRIPIAPLDEQRRIVEAIETQLTRLDAAVAALKRAQANLKRYRASVLKAAVEGRLVPTEAELARREDREFESGNDLLHHNRVKTSSPSSGMAISEGWSCTTIGDIASVGTGATPLRSNNAYYGGGTIPWITSGALNNSLVTEAKEFVTALALSETNLKIFPPGTLLVAMYGEGKTRGKCSELLISATTNQAIAAIVLMEPFREMKRFIRLFLESNYDNTRRSASGGVQPNLNLGLIKAITLPLPPLAEQRRISEETDRQLFSASLQLQSNEKSILRAERMRQSILAQAFSGRLIGDYV